MCVSNFKLCICLWACVSFLKEGGRKEEVNLVDRVARVHCLFFLLLYFTMIFRSYISYPYVASNNSNPWFLTFRVIVPSITRVTEGFTIQPYSRLSLLKSLL